MVTTRSVVLQQNNMNVKPRDKKTIGGVNRHNPSGKWKAVISINGRPKHLGLSETFEDAVAARKAAEEKYYGEYRYKG